MLPFEVADPPIARLGYCEQRQRWLAVKAHHEVRQRAGIVAFRLEGPLLGLKNDEKDGPEALKKSPF